MTVRIRPSGPRGITRPYNSMRASTEPGPQIAQGPPAHRLLQAGRTGYLRPFPLVARKRKLDVILHRHDHPYVRHSEPFKNGEQLLAECRQRRLEGVVSKRKHSPYTSGKCDWVKVKCDQDRKSTRLKCSHLGISYAVVYVV